MRDKFMLISYSAAIGLMVLTVPLTMVYAFDVPEVVDPAPSRQEIARGDLETTHVYRFGESKDDIVEYRDGTIVPTRTFSIELWNSTTQEWEIVGYANTHLHRVKVDNTDLFDISVGQTTRINPKN